MNLSEAVKEELKKSHGAISCVGAFGSNEFMEKVNGDANIAAIEAAREAGVVRYVYISTVENNLPAFLLAGYFNGKRRAEKALMDTFQQNATVMRPGFIYGTRQVPVSSSTSIGIPLWALGKPLQIICSLGPVAALRDLLPGMKAILAIPLPVEVVAKVAVDEAMKNSQEVESEVMEVMGTILSIPDILKQSIR